MKLGINITWPLFTAWWRGVWLGIFIGSAVVGYIFRDQFAHMSSIRIFFCSLIGPGIIFIGEAPFGVVEVIAAVRKFRAASKHQPDF